MKVVYLKDMMIQFFFQGEICKFIFKINLSFTEKFVEILEKMKNLKINLSISRLV
jgi:hypothetical protein